MPQNHHRPRGGKRAGPHGQAAGLPADSNFPGQHRICNRQLVARMIQLAQANPQPLVIDIGAGNGTLTLPLAKAGWQVLAIENDRRLAAQLRRKTETIERVQVIEQDVLRMRLPQRPFAVVANPPFSITTAILSKLLDHPTGSLQQAVLILQLEAARRLIRNPVTDPRILAWRIWFDLQLVQAVPADRFAPPPGVTAAILTVSRRRQLLLPAAGHRCFLGLAQHALRLPGLPLAEALRDIFTAAQLKCLIGALGLQREDPICRLQEAQWAIVYHTMRAYVPPYRWPRRK